MPVIGATFLCGFGANRRLVALELVEALAQRTKPRKTSRLAAAIPPHIAETWTQMGIAAIATRVRLSHCSPAAIRCRT
ncbi:hypothetical protein SSBR45G_07610 [Bradyrhizobium sp. SSBR45G]|nr:hypothetical protein SSBR45G_07610 [Bradyrhizobium sp. SSBR45G]GLH85090.1 hypothetical protein SSBR45R_25500 [Bradyrhizobium sp. SSBR45R]